MSDDFNCCYYDVGHEHCTHPHYCIFNEKRFELEKNIMLVSNKLNFWKQHLENLRNGKCYTDKDYDVVKQKIKVLSNDLKQLRLFEFKAIKGEVNGYGYDE